MHYLEGKKNPTNFLSSQVLSQLYLGLQEWRGWSCTQNLGCAGGGVFISSLCAKTMEFHGCV